MQLYPNPATNQVTVSLLAATEGGVQLEVRDALASPRGQHHVPGQRGLEQRTAHTRPTPRRRSTA
ncbi:MAG: hypothetical protein WKG07_37255 [Hymenobacter sp.]